MRRRDLFLGGALLPITALAVADNEPEPRRMTMVTDWPEGPGLLDSARRLAASIEQVSGERLVIDVFAVGERLRPFESFDAVRDGVADLFHSHSGYFGAKSPGFHHFSGIPFGMSPNELLAWLRFGGGQALFDELGHRFGIKPLLCCSTGIQMGGWFVEPVETLDDFKGLRYRMAGLGGEVYRELGAAVTLVPPADIVDALRSGAIDACEWAGPWLDTELGLNRVANHYYGPGWHEPTGAVMLGVNRALWDSLEPVDRAVIEACAVGEFATSLAEFDAKNTRALADLRKDATTRLQRFDDTMLARFATISADLISTAAASDPLVARIRDSYDRFLHQAKDWSATGQTSFMDARTLHGSR